MKPLIIALMMILLSISVIAEKSVSVTSLNFGSVDRGESLSKIFTVTNDGNESLAEVVFDTDATSIYAATVSPSAPTTLSVGESKEYTLSLTIPVNEEAGSHKIGDLTVDATNYSEDIEAILISPLEGLVFTGESVDVEVLYPPPYDRFEDTDDGAENVGDGKKAEIDIYPGSEVTFIFFLENELQDNGDSDDNEIVDIKATVTILDIDDGDDIEEDSRQFDLDSGSDQKLRISMNIPQRVDTGDYEVLIEVEGEIEDIDQEFTLVRTLKIPIRKESHDINVVVNQVVPNEIGCTRNVRIIGKILNLGNNEQEDAGITIKNAQLGLDYKKHEIELVNDPFDKDSEFQVSFPFEIGKDIAPGDYDIVFKAFRHEIEMDSRITRLKVVACGDKEAEPVEEPEEQKEEETVLPTEVPEESEEPIVQAPIVSAPILEGTESREKKYYETDKFKLLVVLNILVLIVLVYFGSKLLVERSSR